MQFDLGEKLLFQEPRGKIWNEKWIGVWEDIDV